MEANLPNVVPKWPTIMAKMISALVMIIGVMALVGWTFSILLSDNLMQQIAIFKPLTTICFILAGISLWLQNTKLENKYVLIAKICALMIVITALITLVEYAFLIDLKIDHLLFKDTLLRAKNFVPLGRLSPYAATNFVLIGFCLFFLDSKIITFRVTQLLLGLGLALSFFELLGNIYNTRSFSDVFSVHYPEVGLMLIATFMLLTMGVLFVRPEQGITFLLTSKTRSGTLTRYLIPLAISFPIAIGYFELIGFKLSLYQSEIWISFLIESITIFFIALVFIHAYLANKIDNERLQVEQNLKLHQMQVQHLLDHSNAVIYLTDLEGRFLLVNKLFEKLFHKSSYEIIGKKVEDLFAHEIAVKLVENNLRVLKLRDSISVEEVVPNEGKMHTYISNKFPLLNHLGIPYGVGGISTDITEIKRMHELNKENQERFTIALKSAKAGTWSWDILHDLINFDEYTHYLFGMKPNTFPGKFDFFMNLIYYKDRERVADEIAKAMRDGVELETEFRIVYNGGKLRYIASRGRIYRNEAGDAIRMAGVCWDITQRKQTEAELRRAKEVAENLAIKAEEASHAKSDFLAAMSHEIRTPLNGVIGMTGLLLDTPLSDEQREYIETILISSGLLLGIINDILDFSKIESGHMELQKVDFDLQELIDDAVEMIAIQTHKKGIAIGAYIEPDVPEWLIGDPSRIKQVLNNLLSNAVKFTDKGEVSVYIKLLKNVKNKVILNFEVVDTGIGISPSMQAKLFKPFTQGDASVSRRYGGTGLGLAISKRLVDLMSGTIEVESMVGKGSKFSFRIPLAKVTQIKTQMKYTISPELHATRILCVDDNGVNRNIIKRRIESWKMRCDLAINGAEAISMLKKAVQEQDAYKLVLVDHFMPGMSGLELVQVMRELKETQQVPVIILSTIGAMLGLEEMKRLGIAICITKPVRQDRLYESVMTVLNDKNDKLEARSAQSIVPLQKLTANILLVEDNPINKLVTMRILTKLGYQVDTAENGAEALRALNNSTYDLILMDCQMPIMDGYTATAEIRKMEQLQKRHTPIIAMTAHALKGDRKKCLDAGMDDYLAKPIDIKNLAATVERWLLHDKNDKKPKANKTIFSHLIHDVPIIDYERIETIFGNNKEKTKEFFDFFASETKKLLNKIELAIKNKNKDETVTLFHQLKGSAGNSGIMQIHVLSKKAEESMKNDDWNEVLKLYHAILGLFTQFQNEITEKA